MRSLASGSLALALATLASPRLATASSCQILTPSVENTEVPLGCPVIVHAADRITFEPRLIAIRYTSSTPEEIDVTGAVVETAETLPVSFYVHDEACTETIEVRDEPFLRYEIQMAGAEVGDSVRVAGAGGMLTVTAAGPCPGPEALSLSCTEAGVCTLPEDDTDDDGGCNTTGSAPGSLGLLGLGVGLLLAKRRRR